MPVYVLANADKHVLIFFWLEVREWMEVLARISLFARVWPLVVCVYVWV